MNMIVILMSTDRRKIIAPNDPIIQKSPRKTCVILINSKNI